MKKEHAGITNIGSLGTIMRSCWVSWKWLINAPLLWFSLGIASLMRVLVENLHWYSSVQCEPEQGGGGQIIAHSLTQSIQITNERHVAIFLDSWSFLGQPLYLLPESNSKISIGLIVVLAVLWVFATYALYCRVVLKIHTDGLRALLCGVLGITLLTFYTATYWFLILKKTQGHLFHGILSITLLVQLVWDVANSLLGALIAVLCYESYLGRKYVFSVHPIYRITLSRSFSPLFVYYLALLLSGHLLQTLPALAHRYLALDMNFTLALQDWLNIFALAPAFILFLVPAAITTTGIDALAATRKSLVLWYDRFGLLVCLSALILVSEMVVLYGLTALVSLFNREFLIMPMCAYTLGLMLNMFWFVSICNINTTVLLIGSEEPPSFDEH